MDGEEWKDSSDEAPRGGFFSIGGWGTPLTAEQTKKMERGRQEKAALADLTYLSLPIYRGAFVCPKCGGERHRVSYHIANLSMGAHFGSHDGLWVVCKRCEFGTGYRPLDAQEG